MKLFCEIIKELEGMFAVGETKTLSSQVARSMEKKGFLKILGVKKQVSETQRMVNKVEVETKVFEL